MRTKVGVENQTDINSLKGVLRALKEVRKADRSVFYENYKSELIQKIKQLEENDNNDIMKVDFYMGEI